MKYQSIRPKSNHIEILLYVQYFKQHPSIMWFINLENKSGVYEDEWKVQLDYESAGVSFDVFWTWNRWRQTNSGRCVLVSGPGMLEWCKSLASALVSWPFLFFFCLQENIQLASCVELHPRIQGKENSCQTMNYCSVTRQVPSWGEDEETCQESHICIHTHTLCSLKSRGHTRRTETTDLRLEPLKKPIFCYTSHHERHNSELTQHGLNPAEFPTMTSTCSALGSLSWWGLLKGLPALFGSAMQTAHILRLTQVKRAGSRPRAGGSHGRLGVTHDREAPRPSGLTAHRRLLCLRHGVKRIVGI